MHCAMRQSWYGVISYLKNDHWSDTSPFIEVNSIIGRIYLDKMHGQVLHVHFI